MNNIYHKRDKTCKTVFGLNGTHLYKMRPYRCVYIFVVYLSVRFIKLNKEKIWRIDLLHWFYTGTRKTDNGKNNRNTRSKNCWLKTDNNTSGSNWDESACIVMSVTRWSVWEHTKPPSISHGRAATLCLGADSLWSRTEIIWALAVRVSHLGGGHFPLPSVPSSKQKWRVGASRVTESIPTQQQVSY